jgi:predicted 3-demethylubiquinone-9 3-methyltransferase (glyoxalase superfamily)
VASSATAKARNKEGTVKHAAFTLEGREFAAMDSARAHPFTFNVAISFVVNGETQDEIDNYWEKVIRRPKGGTLASVR